MKTIYLLLAICYSLNIFSQNNVSIIENDKESITIKFNFNDFSFTNVKTSIGLANLINANNCYSLLEQGSPDIKKLVCPINIPDIGNFETEIVSVKSKEIENILIAPSKGNLLRNIDPKTIEYNFGKQYFVDEFYPKEIITTSSPYIIRNKRGLTINGNVFQYNPVRKILKINNEIVVKINFNLNIKGDNELTTTNKDDNEFIEIYKRHFKNFKNTNYSPVAEQGSMLIICYDEFIETMQPFVEHKTNMGIPTTIVAFSNIGSTSTQIKNYIQNIYNTSNLKYVLLVGDNSQVPSLMYNDYGQNYGGDNKYSYLSGSDNYPDIFVGRFSAENIEHVKTMVEKSIKYETNPLIDNWLTTGIGIASDEGPGDNNEFDFEHIRNIRTKLLNYNYTDVVELYEGSQGGIDADGDPTFDMLSNFVNSGASIINYCGHGSYNGWGTTGFSNTKIDLLENYQKFPIIISVACQNGNFTDLTCFAEKWLRANINGKPMGAVATLMSSINQPWDPPMRAQDEMNDIITESIQNNIKRSFGGIAMNGCMAMLDSYTNNAYSTMDTWTIFGDPSLVIRNLNPSNITITHPQYISLGSSFLKINSIDSNLNIALKYQDTLIALNQLISDSLTLFFNQINSNDTINIIASGYNKIPYYSKIVVTNNNVDISKVEKNFDYSIYPNPVKDNLKIKYNYDENQTLEISIYDITGKLVLKQYFNTLSNIPTELNVDTKFLNQGLYNINIKSTDINVFEKIILIR